MTLTLANTGQGPLTIDTTVGIVPEGNFGETNNCPLYLPGGQNCTINVTFAPPQTGIRNGSIDVNDSLGSQVVSLTGTGVLTLNLSPTSLAFVNQPVGTTSPAQSITLTNYGSTALTIVSVGITGSGRSEFAQTNNCVGSLVAGGACQIFVTFTPSSQATFNASISISDNGPGSPQIVALGGSSLPSPVVTLSLSSISFKTQYVGTSGLPHGVMLTNTGNAPLTIANVVASPSDFGVVNACGSSVAAGNSCTISVFFDPTTGGTRNGTLTLTDNASNSPQTVGLTGEGQDFSFTNSPSLSTTVSPGQTATYSLTIASQGGFSQTVALSCGGAPAQSTCSVSPSSITLSGTSSSTVSVTVTTTASAAGLLQPMAAPPNSSASRFAMLLGTLGLAMLTTWLGWRRTSGRRLVPYGCAVLLLITVGTTMPGCGGSGGSHTGSEGTPAGSYSLTVTGTFNSGSTTLSHSTKLTLIVQ